MEENNGFARTYGVEFLFENEPQIDMGLVIPQLESVLGKIEHKNSDNFDSLFFLEHQAEFKDGSVPSQVAILKADMKKDDDMLVEEIQQSWQTDDAAGIVSRTNHKVILTDLMASCLEIKDRHIILSNAIKAVVSHSNCIGISYKMTQQILEPHSIINSDDPLLGFLNVRFFNAGEQGFVMDTLGLAALGLYDVQCQYVDLQPNEVSNLLFNLGYYIINEDPVFENGHTVDGVDGEPWKVQFEDAMVAPNRVVLDINPGPKYAVGR